LADPNLKSGVYELQTVKEVVQETSNVPSEVVTQVATDAAKAETIESLKNKALITPPTLGTNAPLTQLELEF
jgi:biotin synthase-related radical SAM superfamily protein